MFKDKIKVNAVDFYHSKDDKEIELVDNDKLLLSNYIIGVKEFKQYSWKEKLEMVEEYIETNNKVPSSTDKNKDIKQLGMWVSTQKKNYKNQEYIMKDENIRKEWEEFVSKYSILFMSNEEQWYDALEKIKLYIETNNKLPSSKDKNKDIKQLGKWVSHQKNNYKNQEYIMKDENIRKEWEEFVSKYSHIFSK